MAKSTELINQTHLPGVVRFDLFSGVQVDVTPIAQMTILELRDRASKLFPEPDGDRFRKPLPGAAVEGQTYLDTDDPEYKKAVNEVELRRDAWFREHIYSLAIEPAPPHTRDSLIDRFKTRVDQLRGLIDMPEDEWIATLMHGVFTSNDDVRDIQRLLLLNAPITFEEVADGLRIFRLKVPKSNNPPVAGSGAQGDGEGQNEQ